MKILSCIENINVAGGGVCCCRFGNQYVRQVNDINSSVDCHAACRSIGGRFFLYSAKGKVSCLAYGIEQS